MPDIVIPYSPRPWQQQLHDTTARFNVIVAHRGSGKSFYAMNELIRKACIGPAYAEYAYILPQIVMARRNVWDRWKRFCQPIPGIYFQNTTMETRFPNGAKVHLLGSDAPDTLRGMHLHGCVLDEFSDMHDDTWLVVRPMLTNNKGWCIWIGTPRGKNAFYKMYVRSQEPDRPSWFGVVLPWQKTGALSEEEVEAARAELSPEGFAQELECSFDAALIGAFYARQIAELRENGRISYEPLYRPDLEVITAWDIGMRDFMSVWWLQRCGNEIFLIDFEEHSGYGFPEWAPIIKNKEETKGYRYGLHIAPHDIRVREPGTGISRLESCDNLGLYFEVCPKQSPEDRIEIVRQTLPKCRFDLNTCAEGVEHLLSYVSKLDNDGAPLGAKHDVHSHAADSIGYGLTYIEQIMGQPMLTRLPFAKR